MTDIQRVFTIWVFTRVFFWQTTCMFNNIFMNLIFPMTKILIFTLWRCDLIWIHQYHAIIRSNVMIAVILNQDKGDSKAVLLKSVSGGSCKQCIDAIHWTQLPVSSIRAQLWGTEMEFPRLLFWNLNGKTFRVWAESVLARLRWNRVENKSGEMKLTPTFSILPLRSVLSLAATSLARWKKIYR